MKANLIKKTLRSLSQQKTIFLTSLLCFVFLCLASAFNAEFRGSVIAFSLISFPLRNSCRP